MKKTNKYVIFNASIVTKIYSSKNIYFYTKNKNEDY